MATPRSQLSQALSQPVKMKEEQDTPCKRSFRLTGAAVCAGPRCQQALAPAGVSPALGLLRAPSGPARRQDTKSNASAAREGSGRAAGKGRAAVLPHYRQNAHRRALPGLPSCLLQRWAWVHTPEPTVRTLSPPHPPYNTETLPLGPEVLVSLQQLQPRPALGVGAVPDLPEGLLMPVGSRDRDLRYRPSTLAPGQARPSR